MTGLTPLRKDVGQILPTPPQFIYDGERESAKREEEGGERESEKSEREKKVEVDFEKEKKEEVDFGKWKMWKSTQAVEDVEEERKCGTRRK